MRPGHDGDRFRFHRGGGVDDLSNFYMFGGAAARKQVIWSGGGGVWLVSESSELLAVIMRYF